MVEHPQKIPFEDKFPARYSVGSLPLPSHTTRQLPTHPIEKKNKWHNKNNENGQAVLENFFDRLTSLQEPQSNMPPARVDDEDKEYDTNLGRAATEIPEDVLLQQRKI